MRRSLALAAVAVVALPMVSACGTRESHTAVLHGASTTTVSATGANNVTQLPSGATSGAASSTATGTGSIPTISTPPPAPGTGGVSTAIITAGCHGSGQGAIKLGSIGPYSDPTMRPGADMLAIWAAYVNAHGGICGRSVQLYLRDDGGSGAAALVAVKELVETQHVAALVDMSTASELTSYQSYVESHQIPVIGGDLATGVWNRSPVFFPQGASPTEQLYALYRLAQRRPGGSKVAVLYCAEVAACTSTFHFELATRLPASIGSAIVYSKEVSRSQLTFTEECRAAKAAGAGTMLAMGDAVFIRRVADSCGEEGVHFAYGVPGLAVTSEMAADAYLSGAAYTVTPVAPWLAAATAGESLFAQLTATYHVARTGASALYLAGALLAQQVLTSLGSQPATPASVLSALRTSVRGFTAGGLTAALTFRPGAQVQVACTGTASVQAGAWQVDGGGALACRSGAPGPLPTP